MQYTLRAIFSLKELHFSFFVKIGHTQSHKYREIFSFQFAMSTIVCSHCSGIFPSRNQLFKHISVCTVKHREELNNVGIVHREVEDVLKEDDTKDVYLVVVGGRHRGKTLGSCERFSFRRQLWEPFAPMLENRGSHGCASSAGYIYALGGGGFKSNLATCERYDIKTNIWTEIAPMMCLRHALTVVSHSGNPHIYCIGGWKDGSVCSADVERYNVIENTWTTMKSMNIARRLAGVAECNGDLFVFGGCISDGNHLSADVVTNGWCTSTAERYDIVGNSWTLLSNLPCKGPASAATVGGSIYIFFHSKCVYRFTPNNSNVNEYVKLCNLPESQWCTFNVSTFGRRIFLVGGAIDGKWTTKCYCFDTITCNFTEMPEMNTPRRRCAATIIEN